MVTGINPVQMAYLIHLTYYSLAGASDLTDMDKGNEGIDIKLKCAGFLTTL